MDYNVRQYKCPSCAGPFVDLYNLPCRHIVCKTCLKNHTDKGKSPSTITCPVDECKQQTTEEKVRPLEKFDELAHHAERQKRRSCAMEHDIILTAYAKGLDQRQPQQDSPIICSSGGSQRDAGPCGENNKGRAAPDPPGWDIEKTMDCLFDTMDDCEHISGFYSNESRDKIIVDVHQGQAETVEAFLKKILQSECKENRFDIVEQSSKPTPLVVIGAKVAVNRRNPDEYVNQHPDVLQRTDQFGTVTCLGEDRDGKLYILTAKHIFDDPETQQETGSFISSICSKLQKVSVEYKGFMGGERLGSRSQFIDIAALPVIEDAQKNIEACPHLIHELETMYTDDGGDSNQLRHDIVFKNGAVSGYTCGEIIEDAYRYFNREQGFRGICFLVKPNPESHKFAEQGDSGALIWTKPGVPLGLVSYHNEHYLYRNTRIRVTYGVRLDHCLEALRRKTGIDIVKCKAYGSPIPVIKRSTDPRDTLFQPETAEVATR